MYVSYIEILNNGRIEHLRITPKFNADKMPIPVVIVGENGTGKTNLLSILADAVFELSAEAFQDALPTQGFGGRAYFRISGGRIKSYNKAGYATYVRFDFEGQGQEFVEKHGSLSDQEIDSWFASDAAASIKALGQQDKAFRVTNAKAEDIFSKSIFAFFPATRAETPYWINIEAREAASFSLREKYTGKIYEPLYIETALGDFTQWMLGVLVDSRLEVALAVSNGTVTPTVASSVADIQKAQSRWQAANTLIRLILDDPQARFVWFGRQSPQKIGILSGGEIRAVGLSALSNGQASLLAIFGSLLRFCDSRVENSSNVFDAKGICIIDEIDSHMHVSLQTRAIPELLRLFPRVQFIVSGHSPLFLMGIEKLFGPIEFIELPEGRVIPAEGYREFEAAFKAFQATQSFSEEIANTAKAQTTPIVWFGGETDPIYFEAASAALGFAELSGRGIFRWIGSTDNAGQGFFTGDDSLKKAAQMMRANPDVMSSPTLLLFDCDAPQPDFDQGNLHVRTMGRNEGNEKVSIGIENLLPSDVFADDFYEERRKERQDGGSSSVRQLNKMKLCNHLCSSPEPRIFEAFRSELERIRDILEV